MKMTHNDISEYMWVPEKGIDIAACSTNGVTRNGIAQIDAKPFTARTTGLVTSHWRPPLD